MANYFIVFCFFLIISALGPTVWYLWIYCNSANANFYFGATLAFASAQVRKNKQTINPSEFICVRRKIVYMLIEFDFLSSFFEPVWETAGQDR